MNIRRWLAFVIVAVVCASPAIRATVYLSSYNFTTGNLPSIYTDESLPSPYKLRAKFEPNYHATDLVNNNWTQLQSVPGTGTYRVDLYWVKYASDESTILEVGPFNTQTVTVQSSSNSPPTIQWTQAPSEVQEGQNYFIQARGSDANGNLTQVNIWKQSAPFGFAGGGDGFNGYSENWTADSGGQWIQFQAQAVDSSGAVSPMIYWTVHVNKRPTIAWEVAPGTVNYQSSYSIRARAQDADGNLITVNIYRDEQPFAFELNGSQSDAYADNPDYCSTYSNVVYRAEAIDATGASSGSIYHTVHVANSMPTSRWDPTLIRTYIGQSYTFTASASDADNNLQQMRAYEYAWEDVNGTPVQRKNFEQFDIVSSSGGPISRSYTHIGGRFWQWNYEYVLIARDTAGTENWPWSGFGNILDVYLDNHSPTPPTLTPAQTSVMVGQTVYLDGSGTDGDQNATEHWLWYQGPDQLPNEWVYLTVSYYPSGTGNTVVNFPFAPTKPGTYRFKSQINDPYALVTTVNVTPVTFVPDTTPPNPPASLAISGVTPTWVYLTWALSNSSDVAEQHAYWQPTSGGTIADILLNINVTGVTVTDLSPGGSYRFYVKARDGSGNYSLPSNEVTLVTPVAPTFLSTPGNQSVNAGQTAIFSVSATGSAPLTYQWLKNGATLVNGGNVNGATAAILTVDNVQSADAGNYSVVVSNSGGSILSPAASLSVIPAVPTVVTPPASQIVFNGSSVNFTVNAKGTSPLSYQWYKNGVAIPNATAAAYTIGSAQAADAANTPGYSVMISNSAGSVSSQPATLVVNVGPAITTSPANQTVRAGDPAMFQVVAAGVPTPSYQWQRNVGGSWVPLGDSGSYSGASTATLTISATTTAMNGDQFRCVVANTNGSVTSGIATLTVTPAGPDITTGLVSWWKFDEGTGNTASDSGSGGNSGTLMGSPAWVAGKVGSHAISFNGSSQYISLPAAHTLPLGSVGRTLAAWVYLTNTDNYIMALEYGDSTVYTARTGWYLGKTNSYVGTAGSQIFEITGGTAFTTAPSVDIGTWTHIAVTVDSVLSSTKFYKNGVLQASTYNTEMTLATTAGPEHYINAGLSPFLIFGQASIDDLRVYNRILSPGEIAALCAYQETGSTPVITDQPDDQAVHVGEGATFSVLASGSPSPTYRWQRAAAGSTTWTDLASGGTYSGVTERLLAIGSATAAMNGDKVRCVITNASGSINSEIATLTVTPAPGPDITTGLVSWWKFDEGSGTTASDSSSGGNSGTLMGSPAWVAGKVGSHAISFNGSSQYISLPTAHTLPMGSVGRTLAAWVYVANTDNYIMVLEYGDSSVYTARTGWYLGKTNSYVGTAGSQIFEITGGTAFTTAPAVDVGTWTHIAVTVDSLLSSAKFYKNGVLQASVYNTEMTLATTPGPDHYINAGLSPFLIFGQASIDDLRVYNRILAPDEIAALCAYQEAGAAPVITGQPSDLTVHAEEGGAFSVAASGSPSPTYRWQRAAAGSTTWSDLENGGSYAGVTERVLAISPATAAMNGDKFRCVVTNASGTATSAPGVLTVLQVGDDGAPQLRVHRPL